MYQLNYLFIAFLSVAELLSYFLLFDYTTHFAIRHYCCRFLSMGAESILFNFYWLEPLEEVIWSKLFPKSEKNHQVKRPLQANFWACETIYNDGAALFGLCYQKWLQISVTYGDHMVNIWKPKDPFLYIFFCFFKKQFCRVISHKCDFLNTAWFHT